METINTTWFLFGRQSDIPEEFSSPTNFGFCRFHYVLDGECIYKDENDTITLEKGHVYLLPRKSYTLHYGKSNRFLHVWGHFQVSGWQFNNIIKFDLKNDTISNHYLNLVDSLSKTFFNVLDENDPSSIATILQDNTQFTIVENVFSSFVTYLYFNYVNTEKKANPFEAVIAYINNNLASDLSNDTLAKITQYSRTHFIQEFTRLYHISPQKYVVKARISQAIVLLMNNEKMYNISYKVGYDNPKSFSRAFKRETNLSPQQYKDLHYFTIHPK